MCIRDSYTMQQDFYKEKLVERGIEVLVPSDADMEIVNQIIFEELCLGVISAESRQEYLRIIEAQRARGAQGVILGCTEIGLLISQADTDLPVFDTTQIHAAAAAQWAVE